LIDGYMVVGRKEAMAPAYTNMTVLVVGAARSGIAVSEFLLSNGARVILTDLKNAAALNSVIAPLKKRSADMGELILELGGHRHESFRTCDMIVPSPGVPLTMPHFEESRRAGIPILAEVELAYRHLRGTVLGITGSNGKTTTTSLVSEFLRSAGLRGHAAGNIGIPLITFVPRSTPDDIYSTELSSFQLECIRNFHPPVACLLNLSPDHLDRYRGFDDYVAAKRRLFMNQNATDTAVLNADDRRSSETAGMINSKPLLFSRHREPERGAFVRGDHVLFRDDPGDQELFSTRDIQLKGSHNLENVLAASAIALAAGVSVESMKGTVRAFRGVEHRLEWVAEIAGVQYFNDSKATNVDATIKSLDAFPRGIHLIAGGRDKGGDFSLLQPMVEERVKHLVVLGEAAGSIREALAGTVEIRNASSLHEAVAFCSRRAVPGDIVLLAPACASFDMFKSYEDRGRIFKEIVLGFQEGGA